MLQNSKLFIYKQYLQGCVMINNRIMKIVVEQKKYRGRDIYIISVMDGTTEIQSETAKSIQERDEILFELAENYGIDDISIKEQKKKKEKKKEVKKLSAIPVIPVLDEEEADEFFEENRELVYDRILEAVRDGIEFELDVIRLFELSGTGVYITSKRSDWLPGLYNAIEWFTHSNEQYEKCAVAKSLIDKLNESSTNNR